MKMVSIRCPNCGATIDLDIDHLAQFCGMCGSKIMLDVETIQQLLIAKEQTKQEAIKATETTKRVEVDAARQIRLAQMQSEEQARQWERQEITEKRSFWRENGSLLVCISLFFVLGFGSVGFLIYSSRHRFDDGRAAHAAAVEQLVEIEDDLEEALRDKDYDRAIMLANKLRLDDNWSSKETDSWNERREEYIRIIQERQRENR